MNIEMGDLMVAFFYGGSMSYSTLKSDLVFQGKVFNVRIDEVKTEGGKRMIVDVVEHGGAVVIFPIDEKSHIWFVEQYRYPARERILELPAGTLDPGEEPETCAVRECREEIGMLPRRMTPLGSFYLAPGYSTEFIHLFLAQDLSPAPLEQDEDEDIQVRRLSVKEVRNLLIKRAFRDSKTIASISLAFKHLGIQP
jgi:ADP-ribose pyrophosphatase